MAPQPLTNRTDYIGSILASACLVHCLVLPLALIFVPSLTLLASEAIHELLVPLTIFNTIISLFFCRRDDNKEWVIPILFGVGIGLTLLSLAADIMMILAGIVLLTAHYLNYKRCKKQQCCNSH